MEISNKSFSGFSLRHKEAYTISFMLLSQGNFLISFWLEFYRRKWKDYRDSIFKVFKLSVVKLEKSIELWFNVTKKNSFNDSI